jgi:hypothetical protein
MKRMGARNAANPHVACDAEGLETWHGRDDPTGTGAPVLDPTCERLPVRYRRGLPQHLLPQRKGRPTVMTSLARSIGGASSCRVNAQKSAVARPRQRSFLGFTVTDEPQPRRCIADSRAGVCSCECRGLPRAGVKANLI